MNSAIRRIFAYVGIVAITLTITSLASAQCANISLDQLKSGKLKRQSFQDARSGALHLQNVDAIFDPIVGFWKVSLDIGDTNIDSAFVQWHSDGTEIMNSKRPPSTQSFCLGVWQRVAPFKYELNHYAISWNPDGSFLGVTSIRESITLAKDGDHYHGSFTITQYDENGTELGGPSGNVTAYRIKVDTVITHL